MTESNRHSKIPESKTGLLVRQLSFVNGLQAICINVVLPGSARLARILLVLSLSFWLSRLRHPDLT